MGVKDSDLGKKVSDVLSIGDWILDVDITPNRPDALSIRGLAREVAAKKALKLKMPQTLKWKTPASGVNPTIENMADASAFAACLVQSVSFRETPQAFQKFLASFGSRSISNLVDVTNIVLFELGHPIHFFDAEKVDPSTITVRRAKAGETLELLDGKKINLHPEDLVIADAARPLSLAGVMGGAHTGVTASTKNILIEVACFNPVLIRATAKRHGISSESSQRFERGLTPHHIDEVMERALWLLKEFSGFEMAGGSKTIDRQIQPKTVLWDRKRIEAKLGSIKQTDNELFEILRRLEYIFQPKGSAATVTFPWYRIDANFLEDVMEDVARLIGYENLERRILETQESIEPVNSIQSFYNLSDQLIDRFVRHGFSDVIHLSFENPEFEKRCGLTSDGAVVLKNPIHADRPNMRRSLIPGLLQTAQKNFFHGEDDIRLVEFGPVFHKKSDAKSLYNESPVVEEWRIACVWLPRPTDKKVLWKNSVDPFYEFKGICENIFASFKMIPATLEAVHLHPNRQFKSKAGFAGELHPLAMKAWDFSGRCFVGEWVVQMRAQKEIYDSPTPFPCIDMDASFVLSQKVSVKEMMNCFEKAKAQYLEKVNVYDLFESKDLGANKKSMTFAMRYRAADKTLTLEEAKKEHDKLVDSALKAFRDQEIALH
jgi:phenylalanyl-tRNA synthetase beta chain